MSRKANFLKQSCPQLIATTSFRMSLDGTYAVKTDKKWVKVIQNLSPNLRKALDKKVKYLSENPNYPSLNTKPYSGVKMC